jgi:PBP1b-binding outer membrane lipoprotein LpoB
MKLCRDFLIILFMALLLIGCRAQVEPTDNSVKVEAELPKVEIKKTPDLDPRTDDDVDIKTPTSPSK